MNVAPDSLLKDICCNLSVEDMESHVLLSLDLANFKNVTDYITNIFWRSQRMMTKLLTI